MKKFSIILALDNENGIGKKWDLAWKIPEDMKYFRDTTTHTKSDKKQNALIMGRKTWESIPEKYRPFKDRKNFILSRSYKDGDMGESWAIKYSQFEACLKDISAMDDIEEIFVIGGWQLYNEVISHECFEKAYITRIFHKYHCDVFFDGLPKNFKRVSRSDMKIHEWIEYEFLIYTRKRGILKTITGLFTK